jgi:hypothetical protein
MIYTRMRLHVRLVHFHLEVTSFSPLTVISMCMRGLGYCAKYNQRLLGKRGLLPELIRSPLPWLPSIQIIPF